MEEMQAYTLDPGGCFRIYSITVFMHHTLHSFNGGSESCRPYLLSGNITLVVAGQHMSTILKKMCLTLTRFVEEGGNHISKEMRYVYEVFFAGDTLLDICQLGARVYERAQREFDTMFTKIVNAFVHSYNEIVKLAAPSMPTLRCTTSER